MIDWAGAAVVGPLRAALPGDGVPRAVLVPADVLGAVPWAAARLPGPGPARYACQELVISTAASARQLLDVAGRSAAAGSVVLVGDPTETLPRVPEEVAALRAGPYPGAVVLDGPDATPDAVLDRLPGAALVHLACHAVSAESVDESRLELTAPLTVRRLLERAGAAGGSTVVLPSCSSDLTTRDHDEALTLATAFLAAGAVTVVGHPLADPRPVRPGSSRSPCTTSSPPGFRRPTRCAAPSSGCSTRPAPRCRACLSRCAGAAAVPCSPTRRCGRRSATRAADYAASRDG